LYDYEHKVNKKKEFRLGQIYRLPELLPLRLAGLTCLLYKNRAVIIKTHHRRVPALPMNTGSLITARK